MVCWSQRWQLTLRFALVVCNSPHICPTFYPQCLAFWSDSRQQALPNVGCMEWQTSRVKSLSAVLGSFFGVAVSKKDGPFAEREETGS